VVKLPTTPFLPRFWITFGFVDHSEGIA